MTLQEAKDQVARELKYGSFEDLYQAWRCHIAPFSKVVTCCDEAAEIYARSKWEEACEAQILSIEIKENLKQRIAEKYNEEFVHVSDVAFLIHSAPKPEFKV